MRSLIKKEWRENRALILGFLVLAPVLSVLFKWLLVSWKRTAPTDSLQFVIPVLLALYVLAVASDLVSGDAGSGRIGFLAALPVRPATLWAAKALFLFGSAILYFGYLLLVEAAILSLAGKAASDLVGPRAAGSFFPLLPIAALAAATMFYSTLIDRGIAAAFAALVSLAGLWFGFTFLVLDVFRLEVREWGAVPHASIVLLAAFLLGSFAAFTRGRIHLGSRLRRAALAAAAFLLVVVPTASYAGIAVHRWRHPTPSDADLVLGYVSVTAKGRWVLATVTRRAHKGPFDVKRPDALWAIRLEDGLIRNLSDLGYLYSAEEVRAEKEERVTLLRADALLPEKKMVYVRVVYDLKAGRVVSARPMPEETLRGPIIVRSGDLRYDVRHGTRILLEGRPPLPLPGGWLLMGAHAPWGAGVLHYRGKERETGAILFDSGEIIPLPHRPTLLPRTRAGKALSIVTEGKGRKSVCRVLRYPLDGGEVEELLTRKSSTFSQSLSPDGSHAVALIGGEAWLLRAADASLTRIEGPVIELNRWVQAIWTEDSRRFLIPAGNGTFRGEVTEDGARVELLPLRRLESRPVWFDGERLLVHSGAFESAWLEVHHVDGTVRRLLPAR